MFSSTSSLGPLLIGCKVGWLIFFPDKFLGLASFTGMLFRRYRVDLTPVLKYIVHQLYNSQATEIVVLLEGINLEDGRNRASA